VQVHGPLQDVVQDRSQRDLAHRDVGARRTVRLIVDDPRGLQDKETELL